MGCTSNKQIIISPGERKRRLSKHSSLDLDQPESVYIPLESNSQLDILTLYTLSTKISKGKFGSVYLASSHKTGKQVAIKIQSRQNESQVFSELNNTFCLDHPNILKFQECFQDTKFYYIVSEYLSGGELITQSSRCFPEQYTKKIIYRLLLAVNHMQSFQIVHRDLKPENILLDSSGDVRIIDFGLSKKYKTGVSIKEVVGTPQYMAPEIMTCDYGPECDLWSIGIIMHTMLLGKPPSLGVGKEEIITRLRSGNLGISLESLGISKEAQKLLSSLLEQKPSDRIKCKEALKHNWFLKNRPKKEEKVTKVQMNGLPGKEKSSILQLGLSFLNDDDLKIAKKMFIKADKNHCGVAIVQTSNRVEMLNFTDFLVSFMQDLIIQKGIPLLYEWCSKDGRFSTDILRKSLSTRGTYLSSTQFTEPFTSLQDFQKYLS